MNSTTTNKPPIANSPESINYVVTLLEQTLATHNEVRKPAEAQVTNLESTPGYCTILCDIIGARNNFSSNTRQTAILSFKNVTHQYWRPRSTNALQDEEKQHLRLKLLTLLDEPEDTIGIQVAILISKIARIDFPQFWPDLLDKLTAGIQDERDVVKQRSLLSLQHVVSVLCSRRLMGNRHQFQQFAPALFGFVSDLWNKLCEMLLGRIYQHAANGGVPAGEVSQLTSYAGMTSLCLKILRRTLEHGIPSFHQSKPVITFLASCLERVKIFDEFRGKLQTGTLMTGIEQVITLHQKLLIHVQQAQPIPFASFLLPSLQYFFSVFKTPFSHQPPPIPQAQINAMLFFKSVVTNSSYAPDTDRSTPRHADISSSLSSLTPFGEANRIVSEFFTDPLIKDLVIVLISQYFLLTSEELKDWEADPEEFIREQEADAWRINRKPCAENLFLTILQQYEQCGTTLVVEYLQHVLKEPVTTDNAVLLREALYNAVGLGQYQLGLAINCSDLFANVFVGELQNPDPRWKILRRRIAWLLGNWVSNIQDDTRPAVYHALVTLMADPDLAVSLTSAEAMRSLVDDVHFSVEQFKPFVDASITAIFRILSACEDSDTQLRVLSVAGVVIEQIGEQMKHHCTAIIGALGALWTTSCDQQLNLLKSSIVRALTKLVHAIGSDPMAQSMHSQIIPVVNYSSDFKSPDSVYLLEDGLLLWLAVLQYSNASSPTLLSLFPHLPEILDHTLEHLEVCMKVLETHLLLGMTDFMQQYAASVADTFSKVVGTVSDEGAMFVYKTLDTLLTLFPNEAPPLLENILTKILLLALDDNESDVAVTHHLSLFARVALQNLKLAFFDRVNNNPQNVEKKNYLVAFLIKWMDKIDNMGQPRMRKLSGLGFSSLLVSTGPRAQDILQGLAMIVSSMIGLIPDTDAPPEDFYELGYFDSSEASTSGSAAERQLHTMIKNDPVTTLTLKTFLLQKINEGIQVHGPPFQAIINSIDPVILKSLST